MLVSKKDSGLDRIRRLIAGSLLGFAASFLGCGPAGTMTTAGDHAPVDASTREDGGGSMDAGPGGSGSSMDAGAGDSGSSVDAGPGDSGGSVDAGPGDSGGSVDAGAGEDGGTPAPPEQYDPCATASCWSQLSFNGTCGTSTLNEDFSSGRYNVHAFSLSIRAGVSVDLTLTRRAGPWEPALIFHDEQGVTIYDGERGVSDAALSIEATHTGRSSEFAAVRILSQTDMLLTGFLTGWHVIDGWFTPTMSTSITYSFTVATDCASPSGLISPPNFDETNVVGGYHLLPDSDPPGLYTRKADGCSRGTRLLIDVLYTVARRWNEIRPEYSPLSFLDLNEGWCSTVNHATHSDGTHADFKAGCATRADCSDVQPAIDLAKLFIDTGEVCGIIFNDAAVQAVVNPYFESEHSYVPWFGTFMRTVGNHTVHFHVRVKKPDGTCN